MLPLVQETLAVAEQARRHLMGLYRQVRQRAVYGRDVPPDAERPVSEVFAGKDAQGRPLTGHRHAYYVATDEDDDGRIDHLTVLAERGFDPAEVQALDRFRRLHLGDGEPLRLLLVGLGTAADFATPLLARSAVWQSATPFVVTRQPKKRGRRRDPPELLGRANERPFARQVLREELHRLRQRRPDLPEVRSVEPLDDPRLGAHRLLPIQFRRQRRKPGDDGGQRSHGAFRIVFAQPVQGPVCLGHSCHFGLGLFLPQSSPPTPDEQP